MLRPERPMNDEAVQHIAPDLCRPGATSGSAFEASAGFCEMCGFQDGRRRLVWPRVRLDEESELNKSLAVGLILGAVTATAAGAVAGYKMMSTPTSANVISATAITKTVKTPRRECHDEQVVHQKEPKDEHRLVGTGVGAVVGGLLGSRIGGGNTRIVTGLAGAAAGGYAGNKIQEKMQNGNTYTTTRKSCVTAYDSREEQAGYDVVYELDGKRHQIHMDHDPGHTIPVQDGQVIADPR
jgi:uncharacterized protein YcfJ